MRKLVEVSEFYNKKHVPIQVRQKIYFQRHVNRTISKILLFYCFCCGLLDLIKMVKDLLSTTTQEVASEIIAQVSSGN